VTAMRWVATHSTAAEAEQAAHEAADALHAELNGAPVDLVLAFFRAPYVAGAERIAEVLRSKLAPACIIGTSAHGVIANGQAIEEGPVLSVAAARLPGVQLHPFILANDAWAEAAEDAVAFTRCAPRVNGAEAVIVLGDPFTLDIERVLAAFNRYAPGVRVVGGLASAAPRPRSNAMFLNDWTSQEGGVAVAIAGNVRLDVIVSQGCRPVGPPLEVTRADANVLVELDGQPALERAEAVLRALDPAEQERLKNGLYLGRPARAGASGQGDYLVRNVLGADRARGVIAVGDHVAERERVRLHVRDVETARDDLEMTLAPQEFDARASGAIVFTCNGRGRNLYGDDGGDAAILQAALGGTPAAGMLCAGEVGPVGARNFLHGHTASIAIARPRATES